MSEQLTLYTAKICPYAHRVELALEEAKADFTRYQIDLKNKPEWYAPQVNPASKVPAVAYGGPQVSPDKPSPESQKIAESLVLLEFVADLYPNSSLLPKDPVLRAKARFFIDAISNKFIPNYINFLMRGGSVEALYSGVEAIQDLLPDNATFALGNEFTIADAAVAPFFARLEVALKNDFGSYNEGDGKKAYETLQTESRFAKFRNYFLALKARESFKKTFDEEYVTKSYAARFESARLQKAAA